MDERSARALSKLDAALAGGDFYGALQVYRTIVKRKVDSGAFGDARALLVSGAAALSRSGKVLEALDLGDMLVKDVLAVAAGEEVARALADVLAIAAAVPGGACTTQAVAYLRSAIRAAGRCEEGVVTPTLLAQLHEATARACVAGGPEFYPDAQRHFLEASAPAAFAELLLVWAARGLAGERDLFLARAVLQLLCMGNMRDANAVHEAFLAGSAAIDSPLAHFLKFLLKTLERDARPLFEMLVDKYGKAIDR